MGRPRKVTAGEEKAQPAEIVIVRETFELKVTFLQPVLGSQPGDRELATAFIAKRSGLAGLPENRPEEFLPDQLEKGRTVFYRMPGTDEPCLMSYQVLGFLKATARVFNGELPGRDGEKISNFRSKVLDRVLVGPPYIRLNVPAGGEMDVLERPLQAQTAMGPRVALAASEMLPAGTWFSCGIELIGGQINEVVLRALLDYGYYRGIGQWHNSGIYGTFRYELTRVE